MLRVWNNRPRFPNNPNPCETIRLFRKDFNCSEGAVLHHESPFYSCDSPSRLSDIFWPVLRKLHLQSSNEVRLRQRDKPSETKKKASQSWQTHLSVSTCWDIKFASSLLFFLEVPSQSAPKTTTPRQENNHETLTLPLHSIHRRAPIYRDKLYRNHASIGLGTLCIVDVVVVVAQGFRRRDAT